jgi:acyl carrier protein
MMVGGEAFPPELARNLRRLVGGRVTNMYGPTETTIWSAVGDVSDAEMPATNVSIGRPLPNQSAYILDQHQQLLPAGVTGELVIGGAGVSRGYWRRPELTSTRFLPDPFAAVPGAKMYRTGDRARFLPDGRIECLGRVDHQVKIRGYRVELGEIEARLRDCATVAEAVVVLREDVPGDKRLVAYVRTADGRALDASELKARLRDTLPEFMVPSAFIALAALPLTPNGKVDRKALPAPGASVPRAAVVSAPVKGDTENLVIKIWQRILGHSDFGMRDNFFDIGGHSLLVVQVLKELRETTGKTIQMTDLFKYTTVEALVRFLSGPSGPAGPTGAATDRGTARADARRAALERRRKH